MIRLLRTSRAVVQPNSIRKLRVVRVLLRFSLAFVLVTLDFCQKNDGLASWTPNLRLVLADGLLEIPIESCLSLHVVA